MALRQSWNGLSLTMSLVHRKTGCCHARRLDTSGGPGHSIGLASRTSRVFLSTIFLNSLPSPPHLHWNASLADTGGLSPPVSAGSAKA